MDSPFNIVATTEGAWLRLCLPHVVAVRVHQHARPDNSEQLRVVSHRLPAQTIAETQRSKVGRHNGTLASALWPAEARD